MPWTDQFKQVLITFIVLFWALVIYSAADSFENLQSLTFVYPDLVWTGVIVNITAFIAWVLSDKP